MLRGIKECKKIGTLVDSYLLWFQSLRFWDHNAQDTILKLGLDSIMLNSSWEAERALEASN